MKKIGISVLFLLGLNWVSADCMYQETDPVCSITWETFTNSCQGWSDTSSWSLPTTYEGTCNPTTELSQDEKTKVYEIMITFLQAKNYLEESWEWYILTGDSFWSQENSWIDFVSKQFFPAIAEYIRSENAKSSPNTKAIAILNEASRVIGYDYYIEKQ